MGIENGILWVSVERPLTVIVNSVDHFPLLKQILPVTTGEV